MANSNMIQKKMSNTKLKLSDLNPHLMCVLCGGYYIDATTIVECLHSFCRSCIVKHLESSKYCPICEVQVHKTKPLINIRPDKTLQDIVYKLVPGLFANEMRNRRRFYRERPHYIKPADSESSGEVSGERKIYVNDENITFSLVYREGPGPGTTSADDSYREFSLPARNDRRHFKCPTGVTVHHLKKLLRAKYDLNDNNYKLEVYFRDQELRDDFTLLDVAYVYLWKTKGTLDLTYKIFENVVKRQKIEETPEKIPETPKQPEPITPDAGKTIETENKPETADATATPATTDHDQMKTEKTDTEKPETEDEKNRTPDPTPVPPEEVKTRPGTKENGVTTEVKEVQLQISESGVMSVSQVVEEDSQIVRTVEETKLTNNPIGGGPGPTPPPPTPAPTPTPVMPAPAPVVPVPVKEVKPGNGEVKPGQKKPAKPYRTIRCSPKTWHPVIPKEKLRPTLMKNSDEPRKPLKFFKMRNMPRFLGNPSSGVKPMFAGTGGGVAGEPPPAPPEEKKPDGSKKILKIDPKTLRPIEKDEGKMGGTTPSAPNLLTNPFIPNNNHFLFSDLHLLPPSAGNYKDKPSAGGFKAPAVPNGGSYPPICFPTPAEHSPPGFYPFGALGKPGTFPFPPPDKMDPLLRASRLSPFGNLAGFNVAGFHASLPPSISRLLNPHQHFRKLSQSLERKNKDESTKDNNTTKRCDDSFKVRKDGEGKEGGTLNDTGVGTLRGELSKGGEDTKRGEETQQQQQQQQKEGGVEKEGGEKNKKRKEVNGETKESASEKKGDGNGDRDGGEEVEKEKDKEKDKDS